MQVCTYVVILVFPFSVQIDEKNKTIFYFKKETSKEGQSKVWEKSMGLSCLRSRHNGRLRFDSRFKPKLNFFHNLLCSSLNLAFQGVSERKAPIPSKSHYESMRLFASAIYATILLTSLTKEAQKKIPKSFLCFE